MRSRSACGSSLTPLRASGRLSPTVCPDKPMRLCWSNGAITQLSYSSMTRWVIHFRNMKTAIVHLMGFVWTGKVAQLPLEVRDGRWHHICVSWTTRDGQWEAYQDGEKQGAGDNLAAWHPIKPGGVIILGQEQVPQWLTWLMTTITQGWYALLKLTPLPLFEELIHFVQQARDPISNSLINSDKITFRKTDKSAVQQCMKDWIICII